MGWFTRRKRTTDAATVVAVAVAPATPSTPHGPAAPSAPAAFANVAPPPTSAQLRAAEDALRRAEHHRRRLEIEVKQLRRGRELDEKDRKRLEQELANASQGRLWAWAEEEVRRLQDALKKTRDRLYRAEEELQRANADRDLFDRRCRNAEDEANRIRDDLRQFERTLAGSRSARPSGAGEAAPASGATNGSRASKAPVVAAARAFEIPTGEDDGMPIDWNDALAGVDGDIELLRILAQSFQDEATDLLSDLRMALDDADWASSGSALRVLRGALTSLGAHGARHALHRLETEIEARHIEAAEDAFVALQLEIDRLGPALRLPTPGVTGARA